MDYKHEVFISYKWSDAKKEWVNKIFEPLLTEILKDELGTRCQIFKDVKDIVSGASLPESIKDGIAHSKCMICIISLPYFSDSIWCPIEFSAMQFRENQLGLRQQGNHTGLIFPIIFIDTEARDIKEKNALYKHDNLRELIFNINPLELSDVYNSTNEAFKQSSSYNDLRRLLQRWVRNSIVPRLENMPPWKAEWNTEEYLSQPFEAFKVAYNVNVKMQTPKL